MRQEDFWQYNELIQAGADYADVRRAMEYDKQMQKIRDYKKRAEEMSSELLLNENELLIDFGCGTGSITVELAKKCKGVFGIDTSSVMLDIASRRAKDEYVSNINFINAGFLSYIHQGEPVDKIITSGAFHHLPDFWKVIALQNMNGMLKDGGTLLISDVVFSFEPKNYKEEINNFLNFIKLKSGEALYEDGILHIKEEFSTFDWLMDEMLVRTGFIIDNKIIKTKTNIDYICKRA